MYRNTKNVPYYVFGREPSPSLAISSAPAGNTAARPSSFSIIFSRA